jgi:excisionase family DNA binding protein
MPRLYRIEEAAELLGVSRPTTYRLIAAGDLGSVDVAPTGSKRPKTRVSDQHIAKFIADRDRKRKPLRTACPPPEGGAPP